MEDTWISGTVVLCYCFLSPETQGVCDDCPLSKHHIASGCETKASFDPPVRVRLERKSKTLIANPD